MTQLELSFSGYVCAPYLHTSTSVELKESWIKSKNIEKLFFVTGTFSSESKPYFDNSTNHYLLAKFKDTTLISKDISNSIKKKHHLFLISKMIFFKGMYLEKLISYLYIIWNMEKMMKIYKTLQIFF